jgi:hypothetical protein
MSNLLQAAAETAIDWSSPTIEHILISHEVSRPDLHVHLAQRLNDGRFTTIAEKSYGRSSQWAAHYDEAARAKTKISARTGLSTRDVVTHLPFLLAADEPRAWGNAIHGDLIVSAAGLEDWQDELICVLALNNWLTVVRKIFRS